MCSNNATVCNVTACFLLFSTGYSDFHHPAGLQTTVNESQLSHNEGMSCNLDRKERESHDHVYTGPMFFTLPCQWASLSRPERSLINMETTVHWN